MGKSNARIYWLHTLSPTHVGTGRGVGYIDLPIHRDKVTNWPIIPGSAFKGVWADWFGATIDKRREESSGRLARLAFGLTDNDLAIAGALIPTDARLVCLPVRSFRGTFAWCTSPLALKLLRRDLELAGMKDIPEAPESHQIPDDTAHYPEEGSLLLEGQQIFLEDLDFKARPCSIAQDWAGKIASWIFPDKDKGDWRRAFISRFAVLPDTVFDFLTVTGTEVVTRVKINDETGTAAETALWNEESLPIETILAGLIHCDRVYSPPPPRRNRAGRDKSPPQRSKNCSNSMRRPP
jgi:CRISPR-associated protein Cmr4